MENKERIRFVIDSNDEIVFDPSDELFEKAKSNERELISVINKHFEDNPKKIMKKACWVIRTLYN